MSSQFDLCSSAFRALTKIPYATSVAPGTFEIHVTLSSLEDCPHVVKCNVQIDIRSNAKGLGVVKGGASVQALPGMPMNGAVRDCVDAVTDHLMVTAVGPKMRNAALSPQPGNTTTLPGTGSGSSQPTAPPPPTP